MSIGSRADERVAQKRVVRGEDAAREQYWKAIADAETLSDLSLHRTSLHLFRPAFASRSDHERIARMIQPSTTRNLCDRSLSVSVEPAQVSRVSLLRTRDWSTAMAALGWKILSLLATASAVFVAVHPVRTTPTPAQKATRVQAPCTTAQGCGAHGPRRACARLGPVSSQ